MKFFRKIAYLLVLLSFTSVIAQVTTCSAIVQKALSDVQQDCAPTGRNQACYGYVSLQATPHDNVQNFAFSKEGDLVNVADIASLRLSHLDVANNTWGIALMKLQANLPDTLPGQNVTFLFFGDVQIQNAVTGVQVTAKSRVNIRSTPSTSGAIIGSVAARETTSANGRNADSTWLRIQIPDSSALGWVSASYLTASGDTSTLTIIDPATPTPPFTPMQAFYFSTGITQTGCTEAPADGILIQTPQGVGQINLRANDVDVQLGSTAFLQAQANGLMTVSVVEGEGHVSADGVTVDVPAGTQATIPMDANLRPSGPPNAAQPYPEALVRPLPVQVLPLHINIVLPSVTESATEAVTPEATASPTPSGGASVGGASGGAIAYSVVKIMNLGGESLSGTVCAVDQPFAVTMTTSKIGFTINFTPGSTTQGSWTYNYTIASAGETDDGSGTYTLSAPAEDGSIQLTMDGKISSKFRGGGGSFPLHYQMQLKPGAAGCGT